MADVVAIIIGVVILVAVGIGTISTTVDTATNNVLVTNESFSAVANNTIQALANEPVVSGSVVIRNSSQPTSPYVLNQNYTVNYADGTFTWLYNTTLGVVNNVTDLNVTYRYLPTGYLSSSTARTVLPLVLVFLGILALVLLAREANLME